MRAAEIERMRAASQEKYFFPKFLFLPHDMLEALSHPWRFDPRAEARPGRDADHSPPSSTEVENEQELYSSISKCLHGV
jgi:hypothetical protein